MSTYYFLFLLLIFRSSNAQYLLAEYAPNHDNYTPANYHFSYGVSDPTTGDHKHHWEKRQGDHVIGEYGLLEPDGATRIVQYTADPHHGFQAVVTRIENPYHISPDQYTQGHALYERPQHSLYNPHNVVQFGHAHQQNLEIQKAIELGTPEILPEGHLEHTGESLAHNPIIVENQPSPEVVDRYYLNQYAGHQQGIVESRGYEEDYGQLEHAHVPQQEIQHVQQVHVTPIPPHHIPQQVHQEIPQVHVTSTPQFHIPQQVHVQQEIPHQQIAHEVHVTPTPQVHIPQQVHVQHEIPHQQIPHEVHVTPTPHVHIQQEIPHQQLAHEVHVTPTPQTHIPLQVHAQQEVQHQQQENAYSTLQHQPNYQEIYQQELPRHVIENIHNQYGNNEPVEARSQDYPVNPNGDNALIQHIKQQLSQQNDQKYNYVVSTTEGYQNAISSTESPYVSTEAPYVSTERSEYISSTTAQPLPHNVAIQPSVQVIPNGENVHSTTVQPPVQVTSEKGFSLNPLLMNLMKYIKDHMPEKYKQSFPDSLKQFLPTEAPKVIVSTTVAPEVKAESYPNNPYLNGEIQQVPIQQVQKEETVQNDPNYGNNPYLNGDVHFATPIENKQQIQQGQNDEQNLNIQKIYYEVDQGAYQQNQGYPQQQDPRYQNYQQQEYQQGYQLSQQETSSLQQGKDGTVFAQVNENGPNLVTPNFYRPVNPNAYNDPNYQPVDNSPAGTSNDFIWQAGDYTAPRDPEILIRHLNETCVSFRFNETNDHEQKDQDIHVWNSGDYTALRAEEELIRSVNVTCQNFTNDYLNNFTSGFNLWHYCKQCLEPVDEEATITAKEVIIGPNGKPMEVFYNANPRTNVYPQTDYPRIPNPTYDIYQDTRTNAEIAGLVDQGTNGEIAGIVKVINPNYVPSDYPKEEIKINKNLETLINDFDAHIKQTQGDYIGNGYQEKDGSPVVYYERVQRKAGN